MKKDVSHYVQTCIKCQRTKVHKHTRSLIGRIDIPSEKFSCINLDLVGPLPYSQGYRFCLTIIDRFSRWFEAIPIADETAETCARAIYTHWISRYGVPSKIITDQGAQFESNLFNTFNTFFGIHHIHTTAYNPKANGIIERQHRQLKQALRACLTDNWVECLPTIMLGLRACYREDIQATTAEMVFGQTLRLPNEIWTHSASEPADVYIRKLRDTMSSIKPIPTSRHGHQRNVFVPQDLESCRHIFLRHDAKRKPLQPIYDGPFEVIRRDEKIFTIIYKGKPKAVTIDRVKPAYELNIDFLDSESFDLPESTRTISIPPAAQPKKVTFAQSPSKAPTIYTRSGRPVRPLQKLNL